jgi:hypothetical protein
MKRLVLLIVLLGTLQSPPSQAITQEERQQCLQISDVLRTRARLDWQETLAWMAGLATQTRPASEALAFFLAYQGALDRIMVEADALPCHPDLRPLQQQLVAGYRKQQQALNLMVQLLILGSLSETDTKTLQEATRQGTLLTRGAEAALLPPPTKDPRLLELERTIKLPPRP